MTTIDGEFIPSPTPKPHPRIKPEASTYAERNRGSMEKWFDYSGNDSYESPRPAGRSVTDEGRRNAELNKGSMSGIMGGYADPPLQRTVHPRAVKGEASEIANQNKGGAMKDLMDNYGKLSVDEKPAQKVHGADAEEYAERNQGWDEEPPAVRTRPEAEEIYDKQNGEMVGNLMRGEVAPPTVRETKIPPQLQESTTPRPQTATRPEARQYLQKNQSSDMSAIMHGETGVSSPVKKQNRMMMKSEDW